MPRMHQEIQLTGMGKYETMSNFPGKINTTPRDAVPSGRITRVIDITSSTEPPLLRMLSVIPFAIALRKINPASLRK